MYGYGGRQNAAYQQQYYYQSSTQEQIQQHHWYAEQDAAHHHFTERTGHQQQQQAGYRTGSMRQVPQIHQQHQQPMRDPYHQPHKRVRQSEQLGHALPQVAQQQQQKQVKQWQQHQQEYGAVERQLQVQPQRQSQQQTQHARPGNAAAPSFLDKLHDEISLFTRQVVPSREQQQERDMVLQRFIEAAQLALPEYASRMTVLLFGSGAAGLALHSSDLDVAIISIAAPDPSTGGFVDGPDKNLVVTCLRRIERMVKWGSARHLLDVADSRLVARARIPVLKLQLRCGLELDVSLNDDGGLRAAQFLQSLQADYTAIQPLTLLLKCILKQRSLSEVFNGGLGSWSLVNMIIAHLMEEDHSGKQVNHLGHMLSGFLRRFGFEFDVTQDAVSVQKQGIVRKAELGRIFGRHGILALQDPLTGREVAGGSHRYADVAELFQRLSERLDAAAASAEGQQAGSDRLSQYLYGDADELDVGNRSPTYRAQVVQQSQWQARQHKFDILDKLLDCQAMLHRPNQAGSTELGAGGGEAGEAGRWQGDGVRSREQQQGGNLRDRDGRVRPQLGQRWKHDLFDQEANGADRGGRDWAPEGSTSRQDGSKKRYRW